MARIQADLNVRTRLIGDCLRPAKQATHHRDRIEPLLQDDGTLAFIYELTGNHIWHSGSLKRLQPARAYAFDRVPQALFSYVTWTKPTVNPHARSGPTKTGGQNHLLSPGKQPRLSMDMLRQLKPHVAFCRTLLSCKPSGADVILSSADGAARQRLSHRVLQFRTR